MRIGRSGAGRTPVSCGFEQGRPVRCRFVHMFKELFKMGWILTAVMVSAASASTGDPRRDSTVEVVERVMPSVVNIATTELRMVSDPYEALLRHMWGQSPVKEHTSIGSGVVIDEEGYLLTNEHVVKRATEIWVKFADGRERQADRIVATGRSDVALLKIRARDGDSFTPIRISADDDLLLGETVIALGNPFGLGGSVSRGILSSKNRRPPPEAGKLGPGDWLQTDAAINPGNSGGPLVNLRGELIGLNVAIYREGEGISFAIPIRIVTDTLAQLMTPEQTRGLWFGAQIKPVVTPESEGVSKASLRVLAVQPNSPAAKGGLAAGDVVISINGRQPRTFIELNTELLDTGGGRNAVFQVRRGDAVRSVTVRMIPEKDVFNAELIRRRTGATLAEMTPELAGRLGLAGLEGLFVQSVDDAGPASDAGIFSGVIVRRVDDTDFASVVDLAKYLNGKARGEKVALDLLLLRKRGNLILQQTPRVLMTLQ